ncbi:MAG: MbtH family protein [Frankia sp.]
MPETAAESTDETATYRVVANDENRYSIWPDDRRDPPGWTSEGTAGSKAACLRRIEELWTDMRPPSRRGTRGPGVTV